MIADQTIYVFPCGIGDGLMATAVAEEYFSRFHLPMQIGHKNPELFENNPHVKCYPEFSCFELEKDPEAVKNKAAKQGFSLLALSYLDFFTVQGKTCNFKMKEENFIASLCARAGISGLVHCKPEIFLTADELKEGKLFEENQIVVISAGQQQYKSWDIGKMQAVIDHFPELNFVQIGDPANPPLAGVLNLCGKLSLRQSAAVLYHSRLFIGSVGAMMHMARAVDCPAMILCPDAENGNVMYYPGFHYIHSSNPCELCRSGEHNISLCPEPHRCMAGITTEMVIPEISKLLSQEREILPVRTEMVIANPAEGLQDWLAQYREFLYGIFSVIYLDETTAIRNKNLPFLFQKNGFCIRWQPDSNIKITNGKIYRYFVERKIFGHRCSFLFHVSEINILNNSKRVKNWQCPRISSAFSARYKGKNYYYPCFWKIVLDFSRENMLLSANEMLEIVIQAIPYLELERDLKARSLFSWFLFRLKSLLFNSIYYLAYLILRK